MKRIIIITAAAAMLCGCSFEKTNPFYTDLKAAPAPETNVEVFKAQYKANKAEWDAALDFLKNNDLETIALGRYDLTPNGTYANVQEYETSLRGAYEAHRKYIDIQYIVSGEEIIEIAPLEDAENEFRPYSEERDCANFASAKNPVSVLATSKVFCVLFPSEAHKPCIANGEPAHVRKVCVKVPYAGE